MNALHNALFDGSIAEVDVLESKSVNGYYTFLMANNARCEKIRAEMEKMRNKR